MNTSIDDLLGIVRMPLGAVRYFRLVSRENRNGQITVGNWFGVPLWTMDERAQSWRSRFPTVDVWIEVQLGDPRGSSDIRTVEVDRDA